MQKAVRWLLNKPLLYSLCDAAVLWSLSNYTLVCVFGIYRYT